MKTHIQVSVYVKWPANGWRSTSSDACLSKLAFRSGSNCDMRTKARDVRCAGRFGHLPLTSNLIFGRRYDRALAD